MTGMPLRVLLVDDDPEDLDLIIDLLERARAAVTTRSAHCCDEGLRLLTEDAPDICLVDYRLGNRSGIEFIQEAGKRAPHVPVVLLTGAGEVDVDRRALEAGATDFLPKADLTVERLERVVRYAVERGRRQQAEARFRAIVENSHDLISIVGTDGTIRFVSPSLAAILGFHPEEKTRVDALLEVHPDERERVERDFARLLAGGRREQIRTQYRVRHAEGGWRLLDTVATNHVDDPNIGGVVVHSRDITMQAADRERIRFQADLLNAVGQAVIATDLEGTVHYWNPAAEGIYGWSREEAMGRDVADLTVPSTTRQQAKEILAALQQGESWRGEFEVSRKDGTVFTALVTDAPIHDEDGTLRGIIGVSSDISHLKRTEAALTERVKELRTLHETGRILNEAELPMEERLRRVVSVIPGGWLYPEITRARILIDGVAFADEGFRETTWRLTADLETPDGRPGRIEVSLTEERPERDEGPFLSEERELLDNLARLVSGALKRENLRRLEDQLRQSQRMEAVGRLAGGVAHDFNNLLTIIQSQIDLLRIELEEDPAAAREILDGELETIAAASERAAALTAQLLAFSREQVLQPRVVDLSEVVENTLRLLRRVIGEDVRLAPDLAQGLPAVRLDPVQLEHVILNLAINARDAMPEGGTLTLRTRTGKNAVDDAGDQVIVEVADTGEGMDEVTLSHIFEPFFTTKPKGRGTGLGLSMVYGVVSQSGGAVRVASEPGKGSTFTLCFPAAEEQPKRREEDEHISGMMGIQDARTLVVEDDASVRKVIVRILEHSGVEVTAVETAEQGLEKLMTDSFDLVLTDLTLPGMSGRALVEQMRKEGRQLPIIVMSGHAEKAREREGLPQDVPFLQKPFTPRQLLERMKELLGDG